MQAQGHLGNLHSKSVVALSLLFLAHASSPAVRGSCQLPRGGNGTLAGQGHEGQRRVKRWLPLLLRLAHSRGARREAGERGRRRRRIERSRGPGEVLSCTCHLLLSQAHPSRSAGATSSGGSMGTAGSSQGGQSLCVKHAPEHLLRGSKGELKEPHGTCWVQRGCTQEVTLWTPGQKVAL